MLQFDKIEGTGNDFIVVADEAAPPLDWSAIAPPLCDRHHGVGADGILLVGSGPDGGLRMRLFNADGSEAEMCGNGIRCTAKFALDHGLTTRRSVDWETGAGAIHTDVLALDGDEAHVRVDMGAPRLRPSDIPVTADGDAALDVAVEAAGQALTLTCVGMGNPHAVAFVDSVAGFPLDVVGPAVENHPLFPRRTNFEVVEVVDPAHLRMRVWERGVGETQACGTGACAAAVAARLVRDTAAEVEVRVPGGVLQLGWDGSGAVFLTGPARTVYRGRLEVPVAAEVKELAQAG